VSRGLARRLHRPAGAWVACPPRLGVGLADHAQRDPADGVGDLGHLGLPAFGQAEHAVVVPGEVAGRDDLAVERPQDPGRHPEFTQGGMTDFGLGIEARSRALLSPGPAAGALYEEAIARLGRTPLRTELGRAHLLYGEWLRRENRRTDAREQLRTAHDLLSAIGAAAFADRAQRELAATGETIRKRTAASRSELTAQEASIARLAVEGRTNPEIGAQLFLSARTVEWHLRKIFAKLGITSRRELRAALGAAP
jgi:DNA-binding CsgD family transcriptional regulator